MMANLNGYELSLLSGDNDEAKEKFKSLLPPNSILKFGCTPHQKLDYIRDLQHHGKNVMMVGDGLNDAGALQQSNFGTAVSEDITSFSPACDAIIKANQLTKLPLYIRLAGWGKKIIITSFVISLLYNVVGLSFAVSANLTPLLAAILMPLSSISVVLFTTGAVHWLAKKHMLI